MKLQMPLLAPPPQPQQQPSSVASKRQAQIQSIYGSIEQIHCNREHVEHLSRPQFSALSNMEAGGGGNGQQ
jgi:hypothetical protein